VTLSWSILLLSLTLILMAAVIGHGAATAERTPGARGRTMLLCLAWGLAGYLLVAAGGLPPGRSPSSLPFWPSSWPDAYLAPVLSFVLAMVPVIPAIIRDVHGWMDRQVER
jgi:hypothetical protein